LLTRTIGFPLELRPQQPLVWPAANGYNRRLLFSNGERFMRLSLIITLLLLAPESLLAKGDPEAGKVKSYTCTGCHGIPGYNNAYPTYSVPKIGGQNYEYLISALKSYRDGERTHPTMELQASSLSEQDIQDISAYFAGLGTDQ
jgi:cytochrome c553